MSLPVKSNQYSNANFQGVAIFPLAMNCNLKLRSHQRHLMQKTHSRKMPITAFLCDEKLSPSTKERFECVLSRNRRYCKRIFRLLAIFKTLHQLKKVESQTTDIIIYRMNLKQRKITKNYQKFMKFSNQIMFVPVSLSIRLVRK